MAHLRHGVDCSREGKDGAHHGGCQSTHATDGDHVLRPVHSPLGKHLARGRQEPDTIQYETTAGELYTLEVIAQNRIAYMSVSTYNWHCVVVWLYLREGGLVSEIVPRNHQCDYSRHPEVGQEADDQCGYYGSGDVVGGPLGFFTGSGYCVETNKGVERSSSTGQYLDMKIHMVYR